MSPRAQKWLLWTVFLGTIPVVFYLGEVERAPALRLAFFAALASWVALAEGVGTGVGAAFFVLGPVQALAYAGLLYALAAAIVRLLARLASAGLRTACVGGLAAICLGASLFEIYQTPLSSSRPRSSVMQIFE